VISLILLHENFGACQFCGFAIEQKKSVNLNAAGKYILRSTTKLKISFCGHCKFKMRTKYLFTDHKIQIKEEGPPQNLDLKLN